MQGILGQACMSRPKHMTYMTLMAAAVRTDEITPVKEDSWTDCLCWSCHKHSSYTVSVLCSSCLPVLPQETPLLIIVLMTRCLSHLRITSGDSAADTVDECSSGLLQLRIPVCYILLALHWGFACFQWELQSHLQSLCYEYMIPVLGGIIWSEASSGLCCWIWPRILLLTFSIAYILRLCLCVQLLSGRALLNSIVSVKMKLSPWQTGKTKKCELWILYKPVCMSAGE